ncbi:MAG: spermine synthase, partial [Solirubrobacterales bacterium]|nr:spermine synthase [Solirubrobacterales bacterium]
FPFVQRDVVSSSNSLVFASTDPIATARLVAAAPRLPSQLRSLADTVATRIGAALSGGTIYTDDRAPVEWLTDLSILHYATGQR